MPVNIDANGFRSVEAAAQVPGTPEQVWQAIASGPGISSWFVPTTLDGRVGGVTTSNFGPGMESQATITAWDPPHYFVAESRDDMDNMGPDDPSVATEWHVETDAGGACTVRVVHRWFTSKDDWDAQFEGHTYGWQAFFRILHLYLENFAGQSAAALQVMGAAPEPKEDAWQALMSALGFPKAEVGQRVATANGAPALTGVVAWAGQPHWPEELLLRVEEPRPGIAHFSSHPMGGTVYLAQRIFYFGDGADEAAARDEAHWQEWVNARFPMPAPEAEAASDAA